MNTQHWTSIVGSAALAFFGCTASDSEGPMRSGERVSPDSVEVRDTGRISDRLPNIALQTHDGETVRFYDDLVKDRVVIVNFMYSRCDGI